MKTFRLLLCAALAVFVAQVAQGQTAADKITAGRAALAAHDLAAAQARFQEALDINPSAQAAAALLGVTRTLTIVNWGSSQNFLNRVGVSSTGRDVYRWKASLAYDSTGWPVFPANLSFHEAAEFWNTTLIPESERARQLGGRHRPEFSHQLHHRRNRTADGRARRLRRRADDARLPARRRIHRSRVLRSGSAREHHRGACGRARRVPHAPARARGQSRVPQGRVARVAKRRPRRAARDDRALSAGLGLHPRAAARARSVVCDRTGQFPEEAEFRANFDKLERSLTELVDLDDGKYGTLAPIFTADWSLRGTLPAFSATGFDFTTVNDATLGGVVLGLTREEFAAALTSPPDTVPELGWEWVSPRPSGNSLLRYLALPGGKHLVAGAAGTLLASDNGTAWTARRIPGANTLGGLAAGLGKVVAVGGAWIHVSTDAGLTWRRVHSGYGPLRAVAFAAGRFVAVGDWGEVLWSDDGEKWRESYSGLMLRDLLHDGTRFIAVGVSTWENRAGVVTSLDGVNWSSAYSSPSTGYGFNAIARGVGRIVVVGSGNAPLISTDGLAFSAATVSSGGNAFNGVAYFSGSFVAAGPAGAVSRATDGTTWTSATSGESAALLGIGAGPDALYVAAANGVVLRSTDGQAFTHVVNPQGIASPVTNLFSIRATDTHLYVSGVGGALLRSADGQTFTALASGTTNALWDILRHDGVLYAVGDAGTIITSSDGVSWTPRTSGTTANLRSISRLNNLFVATGANGTLLTSTDGSLWVARATGVAGFLYGAAYGNGRYVVTGGNTTGISHVLTSTDGATWTSHGHWSGTTFRGIVFHQGRFTTVGSDGVIMRSLDGVDWEYVEGGGNTNIVGLRVIGGRYYAIQGVSSSFGSTQPQTSLLVSSDGLKWVSIPQGTTLGEYAVEMFQGRLYVSGNAAAILRTQTLPATTAPTLRVITAGRELPQGASLVLGVVANSATPVTYQWTKNGTAIPGATSPAYALNNVQPGTAGTYVLTATNSNGSTSTAPIVITVSGAQVAPVIVTQPQSQTVNVGLSATFVVSANGTAPFTYLWKHDGTNVPSGTGASLTVTASTATAGVYTVVVTNAAGSITSAPATLTVDPDIAYTFSTIAGARFSEGNSDGAASAAHFHGPHSIAADASGNLYVSDSMNHTIRRITPAGDVTTLAGSAGISGSTNGVGNAARFNYPRGLVLSADGAVLFVADSTNNAIRRVVIATREVTTYATGLPQPFGLALHNNGTLYASAGHAIHAISGSGVVTLLAGSVNSSSANDGTGAAAGFRMPRGLAFDSGGRLYVADTDNGLIRQITLPGAVVTTYAGKPNSWTKDGSRAEATFYSPSGLAFDAAGSLFVLEENAGVVRRIAADRVLTIGGEPFHWMSADGVRRQARFHISYGIAADPVGNLYIAETWSQVIRKGVPSTSPHFPIFGAVPAQRSIALNSYISLSVPVSGAEPRTYQWFKDGVPIPDSTQTTFTISRVTGSDGGRYSLGITNSFGSIVAPVTTLVVIGADSASNGLLAGSTRQVVGTGNAILTGAFSVEGAGPKEMLIRAVGPTLTTYGVSGALADPQIEIVDATTGSVVAANNDWGQAANASLVSSAFMRVGAFPLTSASKDAAYLGSFAPGTYRVDVTGVNATTGVALLEIYDADLPPRLVYLSTRGHVGTGPDVQIQGFVIKTLATGRSYLIRAIGPSLGLPGSLADPQIEVRNSSGTLLASNDNWGGSATLAELALTAGAMPLGATTKDAAVSFQPTSASTTYTATVTGVGSTSGLGLLEIFEVDADRAAALPPAIVSQPASVSVAAGQPATFGVVVTGKPTPAFQWRRNGNPLLGKTESLLQIAAAQPADAGSYDVLVTNPQGAIGSTSATLSIGAATGSFGAHAVVGPGYVAGQTVTIVNTLNYVGSPGALGWEVPMPAGWSYVSSAGEPGNIKPTVGQTGTLSWAWTSFPASPIRFSYTLSVPAGETATRTLSANAIVRLDGNVNQILTVAPAPLEVRPMRAHSADIDQDFRIGLGELLRVIQLYNVRRDTTRTGAYAVAQDTSEDGFVPDPQRAGAPAAPLARAHSADINRDGRIDLTELTRVIELFNYRSGTTRTGAYRVQAGTEDGFGAGL